MGAREQNSATGALGRGLTSLVNLSVAAAAAIGAVALHSWPVLALGGAAYGALVAWDVAQAKSRRQAPLSDAAAQQVARSLTAARAELARVLDETPPELRAQLDGTLAAVGDLEERAARLVLRADDLTRYLAAVDRAAVAAEVTRLDDAIAQVTDEAARQQYRRARATREEHLRALDDVAGARERILANLTRIGAALEGVPAKIVRMRALDDQAMDLLSDDLNAELDRFTVEIKSFEETLQTLTEVVHP